jgi:ABC-type lipoprotein export system ATPase subunit
LIALRDVAKSYAMGAVEVTALSDLSLTVPSGGMVALMGPSGSGKSTLLNLIGALDAPSRGEVRIKGQDVARLSRDEAAAFRCRTVGFVFQTFNLIPVLTPLENVLLPAQLGRLAGGDALAARAQKLLEQVGLGDRLHQTVNRLSGGQMQRVAIARALINRPPLILADEPTANLDQTTADAVLSVLRSVCREEGATVLVATHDANVVRHCQRVVKLRDGRLVADERRAPEERA